MNTRIRMLTAAAALAVGVTVGLPAVAVANPAPNPCAQFLLAQRCEPYLGVGMRAALARRGVQRPAVTDRVLGQIAGDICRVNDVRPQHEPVLVNPDFRITTFFQAAHAVC